MVRFKQQQPLRRSRRLLALQPHPEEPRRLDGGNDASDTLVETTAASYKKPPSKRRRGPSVERVSLKENVGECVHDEKKDGITIPSKKKPVLKAKKSVSSKVSSSEPLKCLPRHYEEEILKEMQEEHGPDKQFLFMG
jgi:hypothetical protein